MVDSKYEVVDYNPYLEDYYKNIPRWSFNMESFFHDGFLKTCLIGEKNQLDKSCYSGGFIYEGVAFLTAKQL